MKLFIKYNINKTCKLLLQERLDKLPFSCEVIGFGEIEIKKTISDEQHNQLTAVLQKYGVEIMDNRINTFVQKTKDTVIEMICLEEKLPASKISVYLVKKLNYSYNYITKLFSEVTFTSLENFIIIQKIERVKQLIIADELTLAQISNKLSYSSSAHLSGQFKKITGITPTAFQRIIKKRRLNNTTSQPPPHSEIPFHSLAMRSKSSERGKERESA